MCYSERLVVRGGTLRSEEDADGAVDSHNRAGRAARHQPHHSDHHHAIGESGGRREDAMHLLHRQARGRGGGRRARGGDVVRHSEPGQRERDQKYGALAV